MDYSRIIVSSPRSSARVSSKPSGLLRSSARLAPPMSSRHDHPAVRTPYQYPLGFTKPFVNAATLFAKCRSSGSLQYLPTI